MEAESRAAVAVHNLPSPHDFEENDENPEENIWSAPTPPTGSASTIC